MPNDRKSDIALTQIFLTVLGILATIATVLVPAHVAYDLSSRGSSPEKKVEVQYNGPIDPLSDLSAIGARLSVEEGSNARPISEIQIFHVVITNAGRSPILPNEIFEPLSLYTKPPWSILAVRNTLPEDASPLQIKWSKENDQTFVAAPLLLNPGDTALSTVYLTKSKSSIEKTNSEPPTIRLKGRISNLAKFVTPPNPWEKLSKNGWLFIFHTDWSVIFIVVCWMVFFIFYCLLGFKVNIVSRLDVKAVSFLSLAALLSLAASESSATYLFPEVFTQSFGINIWMNSPFIIANTVILLMLTIYNRRQEVREREKREP